MSFLHSLLDAVRSWGRRRANRQTSKRMTAQVEHLDHRQLLSIGFTGNVPIDFPATQQPGVVVIPDNPSVIHPIIPPQFQSLIKASGFDVTAIRLSYDPTTDVLSIGLEGPPANGVSGQQVIAGDADDNGNSATVNPAVTAIDPGFQNPGDMGGSQFMGAFLDLSNPSIPSVVAGIAPEMPGYTKNYTVAQAVVNPQYPGSAPQFGTPLPQFNGNVYLVNDPSHPNFEFAIDHFSQLYQLETGKALTPNATIGVGAFGGSGQDDGISKAFFPAVPISFAGAIQPPPAPCPASPTVYINPHSGYHINTAHPDRIRVNVLGSSGFNATTIVPSTVTLGGAHPFASFTRRFKFDQVPEETFVFRGTDVVLPRGITNATISGQTSSGQSFSSTVQVFNRNYSFYSRAQIASQQARLARAGIVPAAFQQASSGSTALADPPATSPAASIPSTTLTPMVVDAPASANSASTTGASTVVSLNPASRLARAIQSRSATPRFDNAFNRVQARTDKVQATPEARPMVRIDRQNAVVRTHLAPRGGNGGAGGFLNSTLPKFLSQPKGIATAVLGLGA